MFSIALGMALTRLARYGKAALECLGGSVGKSRGPSCGASMQTLEACVTARLNLWNTAKCTDFVSPVGLPACEELNRQCPFNQF